MLAPTHTPTGSKWLQSITPSLSPRHILFIITWVGVQLLLSLLCSVTKYPSLPTLKENLSASWALDGIVDYSEKTCSSVERKLSLKWSKGVPKTKLFFHLISLKDKLSSLGNCVSSACFGKTSGMIVRLFLGNSSSPYPPLLLSLGLRRKSGPLVTTDQN